jgi:uncharacterized protein (TIGR02996 family)
MTPIARDQAERDFARRLRAEPTAENRLVYADWLEEQGNVARAALVREAEGWDIGRFTCNGILSFRDHEGRTRYELFVRDPRAGPPPFLLTDWESCSYHRLNHDGSSIRGPCNWAWLLSLAMARGLEIPGLDAPVADPELET